MSGIKAIETLYRGYRFRSRTEARWAVFFDAAGLRWGYEVEGYELSDGTRYLPDFKVWMNDDDDCYSWFEVKGKAPSKAEIDKIKLLADGDNHHTFIAFGEFCVPEICREGLSGQVILGVTPRAKIIRGKESLFSEFENGCVYAFFEGYDGKIDLDHLYLEDLEFVDQPVGRQVTKVGFIGPVPTLNFGHGRKYRSKRMADCYAAARSARFEHGESGATV